MIGKLFKLLLGILLLPFLFAAGVVLSLMVLFSVMGFTGIVFGLLLTIACIALQAPFLSRRSPFFSKLSGTKRKPEHSRALCTTARSAQQAWRCTLCESRLHLKSSACFSLLSTI